MDGEERKQFQPSSNVIRISSKRDSRFWTYLAKMYLKSYESIELSAMGEAITSAVRAADTLAEKGLATIERITTETIRVEFGSKDFQSQKMINRPKMVVIIRRTPEFEQLWPQQLSEKD